MPRGSTLVSSTFTGTNGNPLTDFTSQNPADGDLVYNTNRFEPTTASIALDARFTGTNFGDVGDSMWCMVQVLGLGEAGGLNEIGVDLRISAGTDAARDMYRVYVRENNTTEIRIGKVVNGTETVLNTTNRGTFADGDSVLGEVEEVGGTTTIRSYHVVSGTPTLIATVTDTTSPLLTGEYGVFGKQVFTANLFGDNFEAGNMEAASSGKDPQLQSRAALQAVSRAANY